MPARTRRNLPRAMCLLPVLPLIACGGDPSSPPGPAPIDGPYAQVFGLETTVFTLVPSKARVVCTPKPGLRQFDFEGVPDAAPDAGKSLRFTVANYTGPSTYAIDYSPAGDEHRVEVAFPSSGQVAKSYKYKFFQYVRADINVTYRSHCDLTLEAQQLPDRTHFTGALSCGALWADFDSVDYVSAPLNGFADLMAKFECDAAS